MHGGYRLGRPDRPGHAERHRRVQRVDHRGGGGGGGTCSGQLLANPGFESGAVSWSATSGVITQDTGEAAHSGSWKAWLDGYGTTTTDTLAQSVTVPSGCTATLTYYLHVDTAETTTTSPYDKLTPDTDGRVRPPSRRTRT